MAYTVSTTFPGHAPMVSSGLTGTDALECVLDDLVAVGLFAEYADAADRIFHRGEGSIISGPFKIEVSQR